MILTLLKNYVWQTNYIVNYITKVLTTSIIRYHKYYTCKIIGVFYKLKFIHDIYFLKTSKSYNSYCISSINSINITIQHRNLNITLTKDKNIIWYPQKYIASQGLYNIIGINSIIRIIIVMLDYYYLYLQAYTKNPVIKLPCVRDVSK